MSEQIGAVLVFVGLFLATSGLLVFLGRSLRVLLGRTKRHRLLGPAALLAAGLVIGSVPFAAQHLYFSIVGLEERERVVNGRQALVLTGWDRSDYSILAKNPGLEILEMGNADVTDATLDLFVGLPKLRELTLNDSRITDDGLSKLRELKQLESLRIARTGVTPDGVAAFLADAPATFREIDVTGNNIPTSILRKWKNAAPTRDDAHPAKGSKRPRKDVTSTETSAIPTQSEMTPMALERLKLTEDTPGHVSTATYLCEASALAYLADTEGKTAFQEILGLEARLFSVGNTQAWLGTSADHIVVAFRGTESPTSLDGLKDILLTDAMNLLVVPEGRLGLDLAAAGVGARFHKGFVDAIADIWPALLPAIEAEVKKSDRPIWITGHSLGGALALVAAWLLKRKFIAVEEVCTFGAPMIGNRAACEAFNRELAGRIHRYVNGRDPVPKLPGLSLVANEFVHVDRERLLGIHPMTGLIEVVGGVAGKAVNGLLAGTLIDEAWKGINAEVATHFLDCYRELLRG